MTNQQNNSLTDANFGYRIHFTDLQRIQIQYLHSKPVTLAVSAHFNVDAWKPGGKAEDIGKTTKEYSKYLLLPFTTPVIPSKTAILVRERQSV